MLAESKVFVTPMDELLRFGGTLELAGLDLSVNLRRVRAVERAIARVLPGVEKSEHVETWRGLRPLTPDDRPILGRPRAFENLVVATGHGMSGISQGVISGKLVAELVAGERPSLDVAPFSPDRFALSSWTICSVGHSNLSAAELLALLREHEIELVADVRRFPVSKRHPQHARPALEASLRGAAIDYAFLGARARRTPRAARSRSSAPRIARCASPRFRAYADALASPEFASGLARLEALARAQPVAFLCAERDWRKCHRRILSDALVARGCRVLHLAPAQGCEAHALDPRARIEAGRVSIRRCSERDGCVTTPGSDGASGASTRAGVAVRSAPLLRRIACVGSVGTLLVAALAFGSGCSDSEKPAGDASSASTTVQARSIPVIWVDILGAARPDLRRGLEGNRHVARGLRAGLGRGRRASTRSRVEFGKSIQ